MSNPIPMAARARKKHTLEHRLLLTATLCLLAMGAVMVYSASSARNLLADEGPTHAYLLKYVIFGAIGLGVMHFVSRFDLGTIRRLTPLLLLGSFALILAVLIPGVGIEVNGARRWLPAGPVQFQPSELMKIALVLHVAGVIASRPRDIADIRRLFKPVILVAGSAVVLVALEPDLGTALVTSFTMAALLVVAGARLRQLALLASLGAVLVLAYAMTAPYRRARLVSFLDPWANAADSGYQSVQGLIALGSGGLFGLGPGQSVQKDLYLPEAHTDFILAIIGEEFGVAGIAVLIGLYALIAFAGLRTAQSAKGMYAKLVAAGVTSLILSQALLNTWTVLGLAPLTGVPLPFISAGSSSLLVLLFGMGLLLNIADGGSAHIRAVPGRTKESRDRDRQRASAADSDRGGRNSGARRSSAGNRRRAAG